MTPVKPSPSDSAQAAAALASQRPTSTRQWVLFFAITLAIITYVDRVCISQAAPAMTADLGLTKPQMGWAFSAFALAYALFEIPGGWLGDWIGPRKVLMRVVVAWSLFTALTGYVKNLWSLVVVRFCFGAGEAGCFPNVTKIFTIWFPPRERVRAQGIMWMSARWGGAFTPLLVMWVFSFMNWRNAFVLFGALGVIWAVAFFIWFRDDPRKHKGVNAAEAQLICGGAAPPIGHSNIPWGRFLSSGTVWLLWAQYFCLSYGWYFYITWLPTYLKEARGASIAESAALAWLPAQYKGAFLSGFPLFFGGLGSLFCGLLAARLAKTMGTTAKARKTMAFIGCTGASVLLLLSMKIQDPVLAMISMGLASFSNDLVMPPAWGACMDVGGKYAGSLSGSMNMMGNLAGFVAPAATAYILTQSANNWALTFWISAIIYFLGGICWLFIDPVTSLEDEAPPTLPAGS